MIVLDASVVVAFFAPTDAHASRARELLSHTDEPLALSVMTLAEVLAGPDPRTEERVSELEPRVVPVTPDDARVLGALRRSTRLKLPDCCVLLAAEAVGATSLLTFDDRLADAARARGLRVP